MKFYAIYAPVLFCALTLCCVNASADIYRYVDSKGVIHFSNTPQSYGASENILKEYPTPPERSGAEMTSTEEACRGVISYAPGGGEKLGDDVPYAKIINRKAEKYGVDPQLVKAVIKAESNFKSRAVSPKGAKGLMQLMPETAKMMGVSDVFDPEENIDGGVRYLRYLLDNFKGDIELTVAAYNCGEGRVARNGNTVPNITETKNYVKKVMKLSENPLTGEKFSRPIYKVVLEDGSVMFTDYPVSSDSAIVD